MRQAKLGASCRVRVPAEKGLTIHSYRVLQLDRRRVCLPARSLVEPGHRSAGDQSQPPDRPVPKRVAYRLIARDTVEEKILDLQKAKRELADAIITSDNSVLAGLTREHMELLLE